MIQNENRLLFKIFTIKNILVGNIGAIYHGDYIEYDYYIIGCKVEIKHFALTIAKKFLYWLCEIESIDYVLGRVRSDNSHALDFHARTGFSIIKKIPLKKQILDNNEVRFEEQTDSRNPDLFLIQIRATKSDLL